jgi:hypothetical protein
VYPMSRNSLSGGSSPPAPQSRTVRSNGLSWQYRRNLQSGVARITFRIWHSRFSIGFV